MATPQTPKKAAAAKKRSGNWDRFVKKATEQRPSIVKATAALDQSGKNPRLLLVCLAATVQKLHKMYCDPSISLLDAEHGAEYYTDSGTLRRACSAHCPSTIHYLYYLKPDDEAWAQFRAHAPSGCRYPPSMQSPPRIATWTHFHTQTAKPIIKAVANKNVGMKYAMATFVPTPARGRHGYSACTVMCGGPFGQTLNPPSK